MTANITTKFKIIEMTAFSILMLLSLAGNSLIVVIFYRNKNLRTTVHYFIANAAFSDLIIPTIKLPAKISVIHHNQQWLVDGVLGDILCKIAWTATKVSLIISVLSMIAIAVDRFYAIVFPMKAGLVSKKNCFRLIIIFWIFACSDNSGVSVLYSSYR